MSKLKFIIQNPIISIVTKLIRPFPKFSFLFNESLITRARNYLVDEFLRSDFTHLLFIDSDIHYNPQDVIAMLALEKDVIGGPYPKKSINWNQFEIGVAVKNNVEFFNAKSNDEWFIPTLKEMHLIYLAKNYLNNIKNQISKC
mgnify:CR=1 FL=1